MHFYAPAPVYGIMNSIEHEGIGIMKKDIHPNYNFVVFKDAASDFAYLTRSTKSSDEKIKWEDGNEYPVVQFEISSASHPFFTGKHKLMDTEGRIEKFRKKYARNKKAEATPAAKEETAAVETPATDDKEK